VYYPIVLAAYRIKKEDLDMNPFAIAWKRIMALTALVLAVLATVAPTTVAAAPLSTTSTATPLPTNDPLPLPALHATVNPLSNVSEASDGYLVVADTEAQRLYVYSIPSFELAAKFDEIELGAHAGTVALPDGRLLIPDERNKQLAVLKLARDRQPAIVARAPLPSFIGLRQDWSAVDLGLQYYFSTSGDSQSPIDVLSIVNLQDYTTKQLKFDLKEPDSEFGVTAGGDAPVVLTHLAEAVEAYSLESLLDSDVTLDSLINGELQPSSTIPVGEGGHGAAFSHHLGLGAFSTLAGLEVVSLTGTTLSDHHILPWDADGRSGGRNARPRLSYDGNYIYGPLAAIVEPEEWAERQNDIHIANLKQGRVKRIELAKGIVGRWGISEPYALFFNIHPDGDYAHLMDVDPDSTTFQEIVARIKLDPLTNPLVPGSPTTEAESRFAAITPDGDWAFVSHGGDGIVSVIDTQKQQVIKKLEIPTSLKGGGYLVAVQPGARLVDTAGR
jgi:hypothetical protein